MERPAIPVLDRLAGAPISWGVREAPAWGVEFPPDRVLAEMRELGLRATEFGPVDYLGETAAAVLRLLDRHGLALVGGFLPVVLHDPAELDESLELARRSAELSAACGGTVLVSAPVADRAWSPPPPLGEAAWSRLLDGFARLDELAAEHGLSHVVHPHVGTLVETDEQVRRLLDASDVQLCLDTGHLAIGGADPAALASEAPERVGHVHLKDVDEAVARRLRAGELSLEQAVRSGVFRPLGAGDIPVAEVVSALERVGYNGWLVLEQDVVLTVAPAPGTGPIEDVRRSVEFLRPLLASGSSRREAPGA